MLGASISRGVEGRVRTATEYNAGDAARYRPPLDRRVPGEQAERAAIVRDDEADVGCPFVGRAVPRHADQLGLLSVVDFGDDGHLPVIVNVGEGVRFLRTEPPEREESLVQRA